MVLGGTSRNESFSELCPTHSFCYRIALQELFTSAVEEYSAMKCVEFCYVLQRHVRVNYEERII
jgi:hypothetical protein